MLRRWQTGLAPLAEAERPSLAGFKRTVAEGDSDEAVAMENEWYGLCLKVASLESVFWNILFL